MIIIDSFPKKISAFVFRICEHLFDEENLYALAED